MKKKMILFNMTLSGGAGKYIVTLARALAKAGCDVHIVIYKDAVDYEIPEGVGFHMLLEGKRWKERKSVEGALRQKLDKLTPFDLILSNSTPSNKLLSKLNLPNAYHVVHSAETKNYTGVFSPFKYWWRRYTYKKLYTGKNLITVSQGLQNYIVNELKAIPNSIQTIYNPFDFEEIKRKAEEKIENIPKEPYIINVARFSLVQKRQDLLLRAYKLANIPHKLVLLGQGEDEAVIRQLIKELELEEQVLLPGFSKNPYAWIKNAELFVLSSDFEGFPRTLVEAAIIGTPAVSTNCPTGPSELLVGKLSKYLATPNNIINLSKTIKIALYQNYFKYDDKVLEKFSHHKIVQNILRLR